MKTYDVTMQATVTKTITVQADDAGEACQKAAELFRIDGSDGEDYILEMVNWDELKGNAS